jgi:hypothetical protein
MEWVSVKEKSPEDSQEVLGWDEEDGFYVCIAWECPIDNGYPKENEGKVFLQKKQSGCGCCDEGMTKNYFWMPLPEKPKE